MKALVICGPTASGKTALAVECAKRLDGEVISADALLVYRRLNIGTAKPTEAEKRGVVHHMIDVVEPTESFSVSDYERLALPILEDIFARGKTPILCGGTGFYLNALLYRSGFGGAPASPALRRELEKFAEEYGREALFERLRKIDPESAARLHPNDVKRVIRAIEIFEETGKRKSEQKDEIVPRFPFQAFAFHYTREALYARIERRVDLMLREGLVDEVKALLMSGVSEQAQCMQGIGYKEVVEFLKSAGLHSTMSVINAENFSTMSDINDENYGIMSDIIKKNTRNYAKRQITFFKRMQNLHWLEPKEVSAAAEEVLNLYDN